MFLYKWSNLALFSALICTRVKPLKTENKSKTNKEGIWAEIQQSLLSQFSLLVEFFTVKIASQKLRYNNFKVGESHP